MRKRSKGSLVLHLMKIGIVGGCMIGLLAGCGSKLQTTTASKKEMPQVPVTQVEPEQVVTEEVVPQEVVSVPQPIQKESRPANPAFDISVEEPARPAPRQELSSEIFAKSKTPDEPMAISSLSEPVAPSTSQVEPIAPSVPSSSNEEIPTTTFEPESPVQDDQISSIDEPLVVAKVMPQEPEQVEITEEALEAALSDIYFDYDQFAIREEASKLLKANAHLLSEKFAEAKIVVEGHCDERGTQSYNLVLGKRRAKAVKTFLQDLGVPEENLQVVSYGKEKPFCMEQTEACWQENRRGHFVIK